MGNEMLLLGAGASVEAGVLGAWKMSKEIVERFKSDSKLARYRDALNIVNDRLIKDAQYRASDPTIDCVDVEALYNALLLLEERETLEITPFVEAWHLPLASIVDAEKVFKDIRYEMTRMLEDLTMIKDETKVEYLSPILNLAERQNGLHVVTLNYDNSVELLCHATNTSFDTGIDGWIKNGRIKHNSHTVKLIKLHGSNYWHWTDGIMTYSEPMSHRMIRRKSHWEENLQMMVAAETNMVIFGQKNKLTAEGPFLDLLRSFDEQLSDVNVLTVVGYSFRDPHINYYISKFLNAGGGNVLRVIGPNFERSEVPYASELRDRRDAGRINLDVIEKYAGDALKSLY